MMNHRKNTVCLRTPFLLCALFAALAAPALDQPTVRVEPTDAVGPRPLKKQTETAVIRDYLEAWRSLNRALEENRADLLDAYFIGTAKEKLTDTIRQQQELGLSTRYQDSAHDISVVFYSPEGLSIQILDNVEYDVQIADHKKIQQIQHVHSRYVAVLTPTEVRWKVRIIQAKPE